MSAIGNSFCKHPNSPKLPANLSTCVTCKSEEDSILSLRAYLAVSPGSILPIADRLALTINGLQLNLADTLAENGRTP